VIVTDRRREILAEPITIGKPKISLSDRLEVVGPKFGGEPRPDDGLLTALFLKEGGGQGIVGPRLVPVALNGELQMGDGLIGLADVDLQRRQGDANFHEIRVDLQRPLVQLASFDGVAKGAIGVAQF